MDPKLRTSGCTQGSQCPLSLALARKMQRPRKTMDSQTKFQGAWDTMSPAESPSSACARTTNFIPNLNSLIEGTENIEKRNTNQIPGMQKRL